MALIVGACAEVARAPDPVDVRLAADSLWAGDTLRLVSTGFDATTAVLLGGAPAVTTQLDDSTLAVELPLTAGDVVVEVSGHGLNPLYTSVRTFGYHSSYEIELAQGQIVPHNGTYGLGYLAADTAGVRRVNVNNGAHSAYAATVHDPLCGRGPGPSYDSTAVIFAPAASLASRGSCNRRAQSFVVTGAPVAGDSGPFVAAYGVYVNAQLSPQVWLASSAHRACLTGPAAPSPCPMFNLEGVFGVRLSPRGDRAIAQTAGAAAGTPGIPVWNSQTGGDAFFLPLVREVNGAAFSVTGDTLYVLGRALGTVAAPNIIVALSATNGAVLGQASLDSASYALGVYDALVTADGRRLIVLSSGSAEPMKEGPRLYVYRLPALSLESVVRVPSADGCAHPTQGCTFGRLIGPGTPTMYVVYGSGSSYQTPAMRSKNFRFDFKP